MSIVGVGPLLTNTPAAWAVIDAILAANPEATLDDRGSYIRVSVPNYCSVQRTDIEAALGVAFLLPGDLERIMPAFAGSFAVSHDEAIWTAAR